MTEETLSLRPLAQQPIEDQRALLRIRNAPSVRSNMYDCEPIAEDTHARWLARIVDDPTCDYHLAYLDRRLVGMVGFTRIDRTHARADWAFYASPDEHGKGLGRRMETAALDIAFGPLALNKLNCEVIDWNTAVIALHRSFGFVEEGRRRAHVMRDGVEHDAVLLGLKRAEWLARRG